MNPGSSSLEVEETDAGIMEAKIDEAAISDEVIVDQLTLGTKRRRIVAIVGMPGIGKTTLATKVYNNLRVKFHFHLRAWCSISQDLDVNRVLRDLLKQIDPYRSSNDPAESLWKSLKGRKYLMFLDDVWDIQQWNSLEQSFPDDNKGSRIILTSRQHDVAPPELLVDRSPHFLNLLNQEASVELLQAKLSQLSLLSPNVGLKIAKKCSGLPLKIVIVAGVLKTIEPDCWDIVVDDLCIVSGTQQTMELSYKHLTGSLKKCLLYFAIFREDEEVSVRKLIRLWISEGFIQKGDTKRLEDAANDYLEDLIGRSLVMVSNGSSLGGAKTCRIHDLVRDFCVQKSKDEGFFHFVRGFDEITTFNEPRDLQRLCIHSDEASFKTLNLFCPNALSLRMNASRAWTSGEEQVTWFCRGISTAIRGFKLLRVLDLEQVFADRFPTEIRHLLHLAFLAFGSTTCLKIPEWICELSKLETLILHGLLECEFPDDFWKLQKLRCLVVSFRTSCYLHVGNHGSLSTLHEMDIISGVVIHRREMECLLRLFPNIRKLSCDVEWGEDDSSNLVVSNSSIESLKLSYSFDPSVPERPTMLEQLCLPVFLRKLTLQGFSLSVGNISTIGELLNLEVLKLRGIIFEGNAWEVKEKEFRNLRVLELAGTSLVKWHTYGDEDLLNCLQKLVLYNCPGLEEVPWFLEDISTLELIVVRGCPDRVVAMVEEIKQNREDLEISITRELSGDEEDE